MIEEPKQPENGQVTPIRKACQISLMFPVVDDEEAYHIKHRIDGLIGDIKDKRYTFNITEM